MEVQPQAHRARLGTEHAGVGLQRAGSMRGLIVLGLVGGRRRVP
jgi:hypothetical protein